MKILVTGVGGQLGHDVMNELDRQRPATGVGSDIAPEYSGVADGSCCHNSRICTYGYN